MFSIIQTTHIRKRERVWRKVEKVKLLLRIDYKGNTLGLFIGNIEIPNSGYNNTTTNNKCNDRNLLNNNNRNNKF